MPTQIGSGSPHIFSADRLSKNRPPETLSSRDASRDSTRDLLSVKHVLSMALPLNRPLHISDSHIGTMPETHECAVWWYEIIQRGIIGLLFHIQAVHLLNNLLPFKIMLRTCPVGAFLLCYSSLITSHRLAIGKVTKQTALFSHLWGKNTDRNPLRK